MERNARTTGCLEAARAVLAIESEAIAAAGGRLDGNLTRAVEMIASHPGKVILTGIGKSGHVARSVAATLCSTGTRAVFLHPAEAAHGDLGIYGPGDPTVLFSKSGGAAELMRLVPVMREFGSPLIGILGNPTSRLAQKVDVLLDASVRREADAHNLAPTASALVAMALGHALAVGLMHARQFGPEDFGRYHPGGQLGRWIRTRVCEAMHSGAEVAWATPGDALREVIIGMTERPLGAACVLHPDGSLAGLITDGDLRRALQAHEDIRGLRAGDIMTDRPVTVTPEVPLREALQLMEERPSQIAVLPVVEPGNGRCAGLIRLHDITRAALG